jgi:phosphoribosylaminoimidazole-succinocarboxamide synthase
VDIWHDLALRVNASLQEWLRPRVLVDFCIIFGRDQQGHEVINSEISPDCMRLQTLDGQSQDKDLFRHGESAEKIVQVWHALVEGLAR